MDMDKELITSTVNLPHPNERPWVFYSFKGDISITGPYFDEDIAKNLTKDPVCGIGTGRFFGGRGGLRY